MDEIEIARHNRKAEERKQLREQYNEWRQHPFTEMFLSYFQVLAAIEKDKAVSEGGIDRDRCAHFHQAYTQVTELPDTVYRRADESIENRYQMEDKGYEGYQGSVPAQSDTGGGAIDI